MGPRWPLLLVIVLAACTRAEARRDTREKPAGGARKQEDAPAAPGTIETRKVGALNFSTSVLSEPDWPPDVEDARARRPRRKTAKAAVDAGRGSTSHRIGYLRHGSVAEVFAAKIENDACPEGWYELVAGGFVCGKAVAFDLSNAGVTLAPRSADVAAPLPYRYGAILADGTPLYRRVLSKADRVELERWPPRAKDDPKDDAGADGDETADAEDKPEPRPRPTLGELRGRGPVVRRLARGFILALDREFAAADAKWWRTTEGFAIPFERVMPMAPVATPRGTWLEGSGRPGSGVVAFVTAKAAHQWQVTPEAGGAAWGPPAAGATEFTGAKSSDLRETTAGWWMRVNDGFTVATMPPEDLAPGEKWIDVDLTRQTLIAFTGMQPVFATRVSSGKRARGEADDDRTTPVGTFRIREKHVTTTMERDVAGTGPYSIVDVPWVMYFSGSFALHGAFWHDQFGTARSHGCVNLAPADARVLFHWVEPRLPDGWHGAYADPDAGTRVVVHGHTR